ncbi:MAG TPA: cellulose synthase operon protein YhjQ/BcsQ [Pirellulales bacterium]
MSSLNKAFIKAFDKSTAAAAQQPQGRGPHFRPTPAKPTTARSDTNAPPASVVEANVTRPPHAAHRALAGSALLTATLPGRAPPVAPAPPVVPATEAASTISAPRSTTASGAPPDSTPKSTAGRTPVPPPVPITIVDSAHAGVRAPYANFVDPPQPVTTRPTAAPPLHAAPAPAAKSQAPVGPHETAASETAPTQTGSIESASSGAAPNVAAAAGAIPSSPASIASAPINPRPVILPISGPSPIWRPVFEVTSFTWPELTEVLLEAAAAQFRTAAGDLAEACRRHRKLVAVTAGHRGEGCTVVTLALAKALAELDQRVILVDAHFEAPGLADSLGVATQVGWEETLTGEKSLTEAMVESLEDRLTVLPLKQAANPEWRLSVARLKAAFDELRRHADVVLVDAGPFGADGDRRNLVSWAGPCRVDRALVVRDLRTTGDDETAEIERRLHGCGIAQWNFVENFAAA